MAGVEATYLRPQTHATSSRIDSLSGFTRFKYADLDQLEAAPRVWLGIENNRGWGVRARYWRLDANDAASDVDDATLPLPVTFVTDTYLSADALELELTRRFCHGC